MSNKGHLIHEELWQCRHAPVETTVYVDEDYDGIFIDKDVNPIKAAVHLEIDDETGERIVTVFSDDGRGNGTPIFTFVLTPSREEQNVP